MISNVMLYNESLQSLSLAHNSLTKMSPIMQQLIRNRCSNLLELDLSHNSIEVEEFTTLMTKMNIERESHFGNLHFKLRVLNLSNNPMRDFQFKVDKLMKEYYKPDKGKYPKLMILANSS
jgi:Leucine-rich repeat (LRR) protein